MIRSIRTSLFDGLAIGLSLLCALHCLVLPVLLVLLPGLVSLGLENEAFHRWMLGVVIPVSVYALTKGCREHNRYPLLILGGVGLVFLVLAILLEERTGVIGEQAFTLIGVALLAVGHLLNFRFCRQQDVCACS